MHTTLHSRPAQPFWDRIAPKYARKPVGDPAAYEAKLTRVRAALSPTDHVLEIGCGTGSTALRLAPSVSRYIAADASGKMIEIAQSKLGPDAPANVAFQQADAADMIAGHPFDVVCAFSLLHLLGNVPQVLARVHEQLKPGGSFISKTVCLRDGPLPIRAMVRALTAVKLAPRVTVLSRAELIRHMQDAGFEVVETTHFGKNRMSPFVIARRPTA